MLGICDECGNKTEVFDTLEHEGRKKCIKCLEKEMGF